MDKNFSIDKLELRQYSLSDQVLRCTCINLQPQMAAESIFVNSELTQFNNQKAVISILYLKNLLNDSTHSVQFTVVCDPTGNVEACIVVSLFTIAKMVENLAQVPPP